MPVAVRVSDPPPAELLRCADRPAGVPAGDATLPAPVRAALIGVAAAFRANADRLDRLVNWSAAGSCPDPAPENAK